MPQQTQELIDMLAGQSSTAVKPLPSPKRLFAVSALLLTLYLGIAGGLLGMRPDLAAQSAQPFFIAELLLMLVLTLDSLYIAAHLAFPDSYQQSPPLGRPLWTLSALGTLFGIELMLPQDSALALFIPPQEVLEIHRMECALCIAALSLLPSLLLFVMIHRGASVHPLIAGAYAAGASTAAVCLLMRLMEPNDSALHLLLWHCAPALLLACIGALLGKFILKW